MICEFVFVLVVSGQPHYVGTFDSCGHSELYKTLFVKEEVESRCLPKDFINLPADFKHRCIDMHNFKGIDDGQGQ